MPKDIMKHNFSFYWNQICHFRQCSNPKILDSHPIMCICWVLPGCICIFASTVACDASLKISLFRFLLWCIYKLLWNFTAMPESFLQIYILSNSLNNFTRRQEGYPYSMHNSPSNFNSFPCRYIKSTGGTNFLSFLALSTHFWN